jgi:hypothetical protein
MTIQAQVDEIFAAQGSPAENHLLTKRVLSCVPHEGATAKTHAIYAVALEDGSVAFHKPFAEASVVGAGLYGHQPHELSVNEAVAWRIAHALGGPVAEIVAPCVLRTVNSKGGSLAAKRFGKGETDQPYTRAPDQCLAAAFFDSLIAQQDRHEGNYHWHDKIWTRLTGHALARKLERRLGSKRPTRLGLGLIDHGYAFARPNGFDRYWCSEFVKWRHEHHREHLSDWEREALERVVGSPDYLGVARYLTPDRAQAFAQRAVRMLNRGTILHVGEW